MRRHVKLFHLAQTRRGPLGRRLYAKPPSEWPEHFKLACALHDELLLPIWMDQIALNKARTSSRRAEVEVAAQACE
jgi:hypothetical protein